MDRKYVFVSDSVRLLNGGEFKRHENKDETIWIETSEPESLPFIKDALERSDLFFNIGVFWRGRPNERAIGRRISNHLIGSLKVLLEKEKQKVVYLEADKR